MRLPRSTWPRPLALLSSRVVGQGGRSLSSLRPANRSRPFRRADASHTVAKLKAGLEKKPVIKQNGSQPLGVMELIFLGTSSAAPTTSRNQQAVAATVGGETWLFDCGEATQLQMVRAGITPLSISRIFISHLHGDHVFGLPGVIAAAGSSSMSQVASTLEVRRWDKVPLQIVGPEGIGAWIRTVLGNSYVGLGRIRLQIHELRGLEAFNQPGHMPHVSGVRPLKAEIPGEIIYPSPDGAWHIPQPEGVGSAPSNPSCRLKVKAVEMDHTVPTVGYVLDEISRPGALHANRIHPILKAHGLPLKLLREFKTGTPIPLPTGEVLHPEDFMESATSRRVAILSDSRDSSRALAHCADADILIHEATNACLQRDRETGRGPELVEMQTVEHGHSTPEMAAKFARAANARHLILTHFSPRYTGSGHGSSMALMEEIAALARVHFHGPVRTARDFLRIQLYPSGHLREVWPPPQPYQFLSWPSVEPYDRRTMLPRRPEAMDNESRDLEAPYE